MWCLIMSKNMNDIFQAIPNDRVAEAARALGRDESEEADQRSRTLAHRILNTPHKPMKAEPKRPRQKSTQDGPTSKPKLSPPRQEG